jgi:hypothetical protein
MRLTDGDAISVQGAFKAELYDKDGVTKLSLSIVADNLLALRKPPKTRPKDVSVQEIMATHLWKCELPRSAFTLKLPLWFNNLELSTKRRRRPLRRSGWKIEQLAHSHTLR